MLFYLKNDRYFGETLKKKGVYETTDKEEMVQLKESAKAWNDVIVNYKPPVNNKALLKKLKKPALVKILEEAEVEFDEMADTDELINLIMEYNLDFDIEEKKGKQGKEEEEAEAKEKVEKEAKEREEKVKAKEEELKAREEALKKKEKELKEKGQTDTPAVLNK